MGDHDLAAKWEEMRENNRAVETVGIVSVNFPTVNLHRINHRKGNANRQYQGSIMARARERIFAAARVEPDS
jgi:hypothetical protein